MKNTVEVNLTPRFQKDLKDLAKRYRSIRKDLQPLIQELQAGNTPGDRIQGLDYQVFKVRLKKRCDPQPPKEAKSCVSMTMAHSRRSPKGARERASRQAIFRKERVRAIE